MTIALEQFVVEDGDDLLTDTLASGASAGNLVIAFVAARFGSSGPVGTFTAPDGFTKAFEIAPMEAHTAAIAYKEAAGGEDELTWTASETHTSSMAGGYEFSGLADPVLDKTADDGSNTSSVSSIATGSTGTLGASSGLAFLVGLSRTGSGGGLSNDGGLTETYDGTTTAFDACNAWLEFSASTALNVTVSQSGSSSRMGAGIATFITSGGGPANFNGTGALAVQAAAISGAGLHHRVSTAALLAQAAAIAGSGLHGRVAPGALTVQAAVIGGTGTRGRASTGALTVQDVTLEGAGVVGRAGTGALLAGTVTISANGTRNRMASGALQAQDAAISGAGEQSGGEEPAPSTRRIDWRRFIG